MFLLLYYLVQNQANMNSLEYLYSNAIRIYGGAMVCFHLIFHYTTTPQKLVRLFIGYFDHKQIDIDITLSYLESL